MRNALSRRGWVLGGIVAVLVALVMTLSLWPRNATQIPVESARSPSLPAAESTSSPGADQPEGSAQAASETVQDTSVIAVAGGAVDRAVCGLRRSPIEALLGPSGVSSTDDGLRDAVVVLETNLADWQQAVEVRQDLQPAIDSAQKVLVAWQAAIVAFDSGDQEAAEAALATATAELRKTDAAAVDGDSC